MLHRFQKNGKGRRLRAYGEENVRFDMHVHSCHSPDSALSVRNIVRSYERHRILPLVCDHNSQRGAQDVYSTLHRMDSGIPLILAEEIMTSEGEIIGLFLNEPVRPHLTPEDTLDAIRDQGALSVVPHPFCSFRTSALRSEALERNRDRIDIIEGFNARVLNADESILAQLYAARNKKPVSVGSDAHTFMELSRNYIAVEPFFSPPELLRNIRFGEIHFRKMPESIHNLTHAVRLARQNGCV